MELYEYLGKKVIVEDIVGNIYKGLAYCYTSSEDNEDGEESIDILTRPDIREGVELYLSEIKSIKIIE